MDTASHHRKIELQSPEDFAYLVNNVRRAAAASVAAAFPPVDGDDGAEHDDDDLHARVESLVEEYIRRTFFLAAPNLTINGLDVDPSPFFSGSDAAGRRGGPDAAAAAAAAAAEPDVEPFDTRRRQRVEDLAREEEDLLRVLARLKRQLPGKAVAARAAAVSGALAADEGAAAAAAEAVAAAAAAAASAAAASATAASATAASATAAATTASATEGEGAALTGLADTAASYRTAVDELVRLKQEMPATVARMERAREAGAYARAEG